MKYLFKLNLGARACSECDFPLAGVKVSLYRNDNDKQVNLAATDPKNTFSKLSNDRIKDKASRLIAEGVLNSNGRADFELKGKYAGGAFDVDIEAASSVYRDAAPKKSVSFHITTLAPVWRKKNKQFITAWSYTLSSKFWCYILSLLRIWAVCGRVVHCKTKRPIGGVNVTAFDRDWLEDDNLGTALTNSSGQFVIYYSDNDFKQGTFIDIEMFGGPDLYFHVKHPLGAPLLTEPSSRGRDPDRENVGHCFCVTLCLDGEIPVIEPVYPPPVFTHVGDYNHQTQIDSAPTGSGLTDSGGRAFHKSIRLNGSLPKKFNGLAMEYRFEVMELDSSGASITPWSVVDIAQVSRTVIGKLLKYAPVSATDPNPIKSEPYTVNGSAGEKKASVVGNWIQVPQESNTFGTEGFFDPQGDQIRLNTKTLGGWSDVDLSGLVTGQSSTSSGKPLAQNRYFSLRMRVRQLGVPASAVIAGVCERIAINNTLYDNMDSHPAWMSAPKSNRLGVAMVDIVQLSSGGGCVDIDSALDVSFTAANPTLGSVRISMTGPGGPYNFNLPAAVAGERFGTATPNGFTVSSLAKCAYIVTLNVQVLLTTGDTIPDNRWDQISFCKV